MTTLKNDLSALHNTFKHWIHGTGAPFTVDDALRFSRDLKQAIAKAALLELGVDQTVFDIDAPVPPTLPENVTAFPSARIVRVIRNGVAS